MAQQDGDLSSAGTAAPWAEQVLGLPDAWQFTRGQGENVAVIDSGVSGNQQLSGRVILEPSLTGTSAGVDCVDHGTGVAGIIAAAPRQRDPFFGVAPGAGILSIKVTDQEGVDAGALATGIVDAVNDHAQIINVSDQVGNTPALSNAVLFAARKDVVIVAAAGNVDQQTGSTGPFYPAAYAGDPATYPNVLSVGAVGADGAVPEFLATGADERFRGRAWCGRAHDRARRHVQAAGRHELRRSVRLGRRRACAGVSPEADRG